PADPVVPDRPRPAADMAAPVGVQVYRKMGVLVRHRDEMFVDLHFDADLLAKFPRHGLLETLGRTLLSAREFPEPAEQSLRRTPRHEDLVPLPADADRDLVMRNDFLR